MDGPAGPGDRRVLRVDLHVAGEEVGQFLRVAHGHADAPLRLELHGGGDDVEGGAQAARHHADPDSTPLVDHLVEEVLGVLRERRGLVDEDDDRGNVSRHGELVGALGTHQLLVAGFPCGDDLPCHGEHVPGLVLAVRDPVEDRRAGGSLGSPGGDPGEREAAAGDVHAPDQRVGHPGELRGDDAQLVGLARVGLADQHPAVVAQAAQGGGAVAVAADGEPLGDGQVAVVLGEGQVLGDDVGQRDFDDDAAAVGAGLDLHAAAVGEPEVGGELRGVRSDVVGGGPARREVDRDGVADPAGPPLDVPGLAALDPGDAGDPVFPAAHHPDGLPAQLEVEFPFLPLRFGAGDGDVEAGADQGGGEAGGPAGGGERRVRERPGRPGGGGEPGRGADGDGAGGGALPDVVGDPAEGGAGQGDRSGLPGQAGQRSEERHAAHGLRGVAEGGGVAVGEGPVPVACGHRWGSLSSCCVRCGARGGVAVAAARGAGPPPQRNVRQVRSGQVSGWCSTSTRQPGPCGGRGCG